MIEETGEEPQVDPQIESQVEETTAEEPVIEEPVQDTGDEGKEARPVSPFIKRLRDSGFDVSEDADEEDLYGSLIERIQAQEEVRRQIQEERKHREQLAKDLEEARKQLESRQVEVPQEKPKEVPEESPWGPLEQIDRESLRFVEQDPETGLYRSRPEYAEVGGKEVADKANKYQMEIRRRSSALLQDPINTVWSGVSSKVDKLVQERAEKLIEERLKAYDASAKNSITTAFEKRQQTQSKAQRIESFWENSANKLIKFDSTGNPLQDLSGNVIKTDMGKVFYEELQFIKNDLGVKDEEQALQAAWRNTVRAVPQAPPVAPVQEAPAKEQAPEKVEPTREEKKRKFVERRVKTDPSVPAGDAVYQESAKETPRFKGRISLADLVKEADE